LGSKILDRLDEQGHELVVAHALVALAVAVLELFYRLGQQNILIAAVEGAKEIFCPIKTIINDVDSEHPSEAGAPLDAIVARARERGMSEDWVHDEIADLRRRGDVYSPNTDQYKVV